MKPFQDRRILITGGNKYFPFKAVQTNAIATETLA
jgi:hypothetical protein